MYEPLSLFSLTGLSPKEYRCKITQCDTTNSTVFEYGDIFEHNSDGEKDYCKSLMAQSNSTQSQCSFAGSHYQTCEPSGGNQMIFARKVSTLFDYQLAEGPNVWNFPYLCHIRWSTQPILSAFCFCDQIFGCPENIRNYGFPDIYWP